MNFANQNIDNYELNEINDLIAKDIIRSEKIIKDIKNEYDNEKTRFINDVVAPVKDRFVLPGTDGGYRGEGSA